MFTNVLSSLLLNYSIIANNTSSGLSISLCRCVVYWGGTKAAGKEVFLASTSLVQIDISRAILVWLLGINLRTSEGCGCQSVNHAASPSTSRHLGGDESRFTRQRTLVVGWVSSVVNCRRCRSEFRQNFVWSTAPTGSRMYITCCDGGACSIRESIWRTATSACTNISVSPVTLISVSHCVSLQNQSHKSSKSTSA